MREKAGSAFSHDCPFPEREGVQTRKMFPQSNCMLEDFVLVCQKLQPIHR